MLEKEYQYYKEHKDELLKQYKNKYIVIVDNKIVGSYESREDALAETVKTHEIGTFLIQHITDKEEELIQRFHSRVYV